MFGKTIIHNHFNINLGENIMATLQEILAKIDTIATAGNIAEVKAEVAEVKAALDANSTADAAVKLSNDEQQTVIEALVDKLAAAPAPEPTA
jgi:hypothetical protein